MLKDEAIKNLTERAELGKTDLIDVGDLSEEKKVQKKNPYKKLHYSTDHLPLYHEFSSLIGLYFPLQVYSKK